MIAVLGLLCAGAAAITTSAAEPQSRPIETVLREPLPPERLSCRSDARQIEIAGPTFAYAIDRRSGAVLRLEARRGDRKVVEFREAADLRIDQYRLNGPATKGSTEIIENTPALVVLKTLGELGAGKTGSRPLPYELRSTFYNDGVLVCEVTLRPAENIVLREGISHRLSASGEWTHYVHKNRLRYDGDSPEANPPLPPAGKRIGMKTPTSCLQVFSPAAGLAMFTDAGAIHVAPPGLETASLEVVPVEEGRPPAVLMAQHLVRIGSGSEPYVLEAGKQFHFRLGWSVAPCRLPHVRQADLRMFVWIGDANNPYPTDAEIDEVARLGFTLFQMHRLGNPGEPRPPHGELARVIQRVHQSGMLFIWTDSTNLMYSNPETRRRHADGTWTRWEGTSYGGRYRAAMDPYCDLEAVCIGAPHGLADYRLGLLEKMFDQYDVDGLYLDDNYALPACRHGELHGHPREPYDCLIELHEMNWRRRQAVHRRCPHAVLIDHCGRGILLPVICDFDVQLFGEGRNFDTLQGFWDFFCSFRNLPAQGCMWPGDGEDVRCPTEMAYHFDLLTGGGQYCYLDWRLWPKKFPYARGVTESEGLYLRAYNLAQYYFGFYESTVFPFATSGGIFSTASRDTFATIYRNNVWGDYLIAIANRSAETRSSGLRIHATAPLGLSSNQVYTIWDVHERSLVSGGPDKLAAMLGEAEISPRHLNLYYLRPRNGETPCHLWGGKRIAERWDAAGRRLSVDLHAPPALEDLVVFWTGNRTVRRVLVNGQPGAFAVDPGGPMVFGKVRLTAPNTKVELECSSDGKWGLPTGELQAHEISKVVHASAIASSGKITGSAVRQPDRIEVDSLYTGYSPDAISDTKAWDEHGAALAGRVLGNADTSWASAENDEAHWITLCWNQPQTIRCADIWWAAQSMWPVRFKLQYWDAQQNTFADVPSVAWQGVNTQHSAVDFPPVCTTRLRLIQDAAGGGAGRPRIMFVQEFRADPE
ncbi:MAG: discoidin domain-containing protein [Pirellulales bacterium]|nr:discoidin domain-containing protein [Pirellulales bacterium]